jgi:hypothetical protein
MLIFNEWYGRLGNNILQLSHAMAIAIAHKHNIKFNVKNHLFFDIIVINNYFDKYNNNNEVITDKYNYYYTDRNAILQKVYTENIDERNQILKKAFLIKNINKLNENDLVIHIRSGDIFSSTPHPMYVPPPLSYYVKEINKFNYEKIHIICEDTLNPVVNELLKLYKNSSYEKNSLEKDIRIILGTKNILYSVGTFIPALLMLSDNIKYIHSPFKDLEKDNQEYYKIMCPWKNTSKQRDFILSYDCN